MQPVGINYFLLLFWKLFKPRFMKDQDAFHLIKKGDPSALAIIYQQNRQKCVRWALKNCYNVHTQLNCSIDDAIDLFQDALVIFHQNAVSGRLSELKVKLSTYLIAIMRNKWRSRTRQPILPLEAAGVISEIHPESKPDVQAEVRKTLEKMEESCREMLTLRYFMEFDFEDIAEVMRYKNGSTVRNLISRCRNKFRQIYSRTIFQS